jgi:8-amino-3,8-dideoxy-alpha-D-manno-octulosonate transaminase
MPGFEVVGQEELHEVRDVFARGGVLFRHGFDAARGDCYKVRDFERAFAERMGVKYALAVSSGTAALRVALAALPIEPGDEVITQAFTFVATVEAIIESRGVPICAEVDDTLNIDPADLERRIGPRTKAVIAVHMLGSPARLREIREICHRRGIALIEDTAWGCGGNLDGKPLGTWGVMGTYSFDFAKTMTTGEGGMLVFRDAETYARAAAWHDHGHENNPSVPRWEDTRSSSGFNFRMMELQGAVGLAQLRKLDEVVRRQRQNRDRIWSALSDLGGLCLRALPAGSFDTADALVLRVPSRDVAIRCRTELLNAGLGTKILPEAYNWHFAGTWDHMPELVSAHGGSLRDAFPRTVSLLGSTVALPIGVSMPDDVPARVRRALATCL